MKISNTHHQTRTGQIKRNPINKISEKQIKNQFHMNPDWESEEVYDFFVKNWSKEKEKIEGDELLEKILIIEGR